MKNQLSKSKREELKKMQEQLIRGFEEPYDEALSEFLYISSHTEGRNGSTYKSDIGHEFIIWIHNDDQHPMPESELIKYEVTQDDMFPGYYRFEMTLPYEEYK